MLARHRIAIDGHLARRIGGDRTPIRDVDLLAALRGRIHHHDAFHEVVRCPRDRAMRLRRQGGRTAAAWPFGVAMRRRSRRFGRFRRLGRGFRRPRIGFASWQRDRRLGRERAAGIDRGGKLGRQRKRRRHWQRFDARRRGRGVFCFMRLRARGDGFRWAFERGGSARFGKRFMRLTRPGAFVRPRCGRAPRRPAFRATCRPFLGGLFERSLHDALHARAFQFLEYIGGLPRRGAWVVLHT
ncbi:hypothetical protein, partial [Caballeronia arationis]|uniref:hypothetical protein n=1 Tax=Caballeronia arationis TaxID=1777142 RepID=UPI0011981FDF